MKHLDGTEAPSGILSSDEGGICFEVFFDTFDAAGLER
jgi:hypothetical protein